MTVIPQKPPPGTGLLLHRHTNVMLDRHATHTTHVSAIHQGTHPNGALSQTSAMCVATEPQQAGKRSSMPTIANKTKIIVATLCIAGICTAFASAIAPLPAMAAREVKKPYDRQIMRLSEILGAVHYLRELCGAGDGQLWRDHMRALMKAEGSSALRRARMTRRFNQGYRSYSRTYNACTPSAKTAIKRFLEEGNELSMGLLRSFPE